MSISRTLIAVVLVSFSLFFSGCVKEGCLDPASENYDPSAGKQCDDCCVYDASNNQTNLSLNLSHKVDSLDFMLGTPYLVNGRLVTFEFAQFYLSSFALIKADGSKLEIDSLIVLINPKTNSINLGNIEAGDYTGIEFALGIDTPNNHTIPNSYPDDHPLAAKTPRMFWNVPNGYIFINANGTFDASTPPDGTIDANWLYEVGTDELFTKYTIEQQFNAPTSGNVNLSIDIDYKRILSTNNLPENRETLTIDKPNLAKQIMRNFSMAFKAAKFE